ncbi:MAG: hypothetical protein ACRDOD_08555, partial [Streptosporangiaceae bacterium]
GFGGTVFHSARWDRSCDLTGQLAPETLEAYRGVTVTGFPNLFLLLGPNTGLGHTSVVFMIESQIQHVLSCLRILAKTGADTIGARRADYAVTGA